MFLLEGFQQFMFWETLKLRLTDFDFEYLVEILIELSLSL